MSMSGDRLLSEAKDVMLGSQSGAGLTTGTDNIFLGPVAGAVVTTGSRNTFIGDGAAQSATTSSDCVVLGKNAAKLMTTANGVIAIGTSAMESNLSSDDVVAIGYEALKTATDCEGAVVMGRNAADTCTTFTDSVAVGAYALGNTGLVTIDKCTAVGAYAGYEVATAPTECAFLGYEAGRGSSGTKNTYVGYQTGKDLTGSNNTLIGSLAGVNLAATSTGNVCLGANSGPNTSTAESNKLYIFAGSSTSATNLVTGDFSAGTVSFGGSFQVTGATLDVSDTNNPEFELLNTTETDADAGRPTTVGHFGNTDGATEFAMWTVAHDGSGADQKGKLTLSVNSTSDTAMTIDSATDIVMPGDLSCLSFTETSDERHKQAIRDLEDVSEKALAIEALHYVLAGDRHTGFSAQQLGDLLPEVVTEVGGRLCVDVTGVLAVAVKYAQGRCRR